MTRPELSEHQWAAFLQGLARILPTNRFYQEKFSGAGLALADLRAPADLARIPFTTKDELVRDQQAHPPYGTNLSEPIGRYVRLHQTSGSSGRRLRWLDTPESWHWILTLWEEIFDAVELRGDDRLFFPFSFGPFLGFWAAFEGACRRGCFVLPGGGMTTLARLEAIAEHRISIVCCTPTHAMHLADAAAKHAIDLTASTVRMLILAGEPGANVPAVRRRIEQDWGARLIDHSGMTEIASLGIEFAALPEKLFLLEHHCIAEFVQPDGDQPVSEGQEGELVITNLGRWASPAIRYRTGDICRWRADVHPPGKPFVYLDGGILGRTDDMLWIKGNNVYPSSFEAVLRADPVVAEFLIEVDDSTFPARVVLLVEPTSADLAGKPWLARLESTFQDRLSFRPEIRCVAPGSLPRHEFKSRRIRKAALPDSSPAGIRESSLEVPQ